MFAYHDPSPFEKEGGFGYHHSVFWLVLMLSKACGMKFEAKSNKNAYFFFPEWASEWARRRSTMLGFFAQKCKNKKKLTRRIAHLLQKIIHSSTTRGGGEKALCRENCGVG